jgi:hypothetical protein
VLARPAPLGLSVPDQDQLAHAQHHFTAPAVAAWPDHDRAKPSLSSLSAA